MNSKELADLSQTPISTIRYYEKIKLLPAPNRLQNNYRQYEKRHAILLEFIKNLSLAGFSLKDIRYLFDELISKESLTDYAIEQIKERSQAIEQEITQLTQLKTFLDDFAKETDEVADFLNTIRQQL